MERKERRTEKQKETPAQIFISSFVYLFNWNNFYCCAVVCVRILTLLPLGAEPFIKTWLGPSFVEQEQEQEKVEMLCWLFPAWLADWLLLENFSREIFLFSFFRLFLFLKCFQPCCTCFINEPAAPALAPVPATVPTKHSQL